MLASPASGLLQSASGSPPPAVTLPAAPSPGSLGASSAVGSLCDGLPAYFYDPPIEAVVFGFGVNEDGQLGLEIVSGGAAANNVLVSSEREHIITGGERGAWWMPRVPLPSAQGSRPVGTAVEGVRLHLQPGSGWLPG